MISFLVRVFIPAEPKLDRPAWGAAGTFGRRCASAAGSAAGAAAAVVAAASAVRRQPAACAAAGAEPG